MMLSRIKNNFRQSDPKSKAIVLMYHRVCNVPTDPWQLAVSPNNFENQIQTIVKNFNVLPVSDLIEQFSNKKIKPNSVYITFDDAYQDNYLYAKPILEKYNCPATFFVPTHFVGKEQMFWWDELEEIILHSKTLPNKLTFNIDEQVFNFQFDIEELTEHVQKKQETWYWPKQPVTNRCKLYLEVWELLKPLPYEKITHILKYIKEWAKFIPSTINESFCMNSEQLKNLTSNKLFTLGIHTETHPALASHSLEIQLNEITISKKYLDVYNFRKVNAIAYPYGNYNNHTIASVEKNELDLGFTTSGGIITKKSSPLILGRFQVIDQDGKTLNEIIMELLS